MKIYLPNDQGGVSLATVVNGKLEAALGALLQEFVDLCMPAESEGLYLLNDARTGARYLECHVRASKLIEHGTIDVPLDPDDQPEYRANRDLVEDHVAYEQMKKDAIAKRTFSNLVTEFISDEKKPIKIIGGQHRFTAIQEALTQGVDELHGLKVYFQLTPEQRIDAQLISNTNIAVSLDLLDRMHETLAGPELRIWCQAVGLLEKDKDFADRRERTQPITVRAARTFIVNYLRGRGLKAKPFDAADTSPIICKSGVTDPEWEAARKTKPSLWTDTKLKAAGVAFSHLVLAQRKAFSKGKTTNKGVARPQTDFIEKALNYAVLGAWAMTAGLLEDNPTRLQRHFGLKDQAGRDPLNAAALAKGRHKSDPENYRGLGYRTDAKERGRLVELFYAQAEKGDGIAPALIDLAIKKYHAKEARLDVLKAEQKAQGNG